MYPYKVMNYPLAGPPGAPGENGSDGKEGPEGRRGEPGQEGAPGERGASKLPLVNIFDFLMNKKCDL